MNVAKAKSAAVLERKIEELFRKAFAESWSVSALNFELDAEQWPGLPESTRQSVLRAMALFSFLEQSVTNYLGPLLYAAPHERDTAFLGTQIGDEARHTYFFQRLFAEIFHTGCGLADSRQVVGSTAASSFFKIFDEHLKNGVDLVRREPQNRSAMVRAVLIYHLIVEGFIAHGGQLRLLNFFKAKAILPGMKAGFDGLVRDESRHISWGVLFLELAVLEDPAVVDQIVACLDELAEPLVAAVVDPELRQPASSHACLPDWRHDLLEDKLAHRLKIIGVPANASQAILATYAAQFETQWDKHLSLHGIEHAGRVYHLSMIAAK